jgi:hypothetical protein
MTSKSSLTLKLRILTASILFIAVLIALIASAAPAQQADSAQRSAKPSAVPRPATTLAQGLAFAPRPGVGNAQRVSAARSQGEKAASAAPDSGGVSFLPAVTYGSGGYVAQSIRIADLNADGKLDIVVADWWDTNNVGVVGVLLGNGDGTFQPAVTYKTGGAPNYSLVVADVNGDGKPDLIVSSCAASASTCGSAQGVVSVLLGNGDGTFQHALSYGSGAPVGAHVAVADVNGDGKPDLIATNYQGEANGDGTVAVLLGNGNGTFQSPVLYDSGAPGANGLTVADVNGDGALDLLVANGCFSYCTGGLESLTVLSVLLGNGDGTFQPPATYATSGKNSGWVSVADLNGDGKLDAVLSSLNIFIPNGIVSVLLGRGDGTFEPAVTYDSGGYAAPELALADVNGDGRLDIIVDNCGPVGGCGTGVIGVLLGRGDGSFDPVVTFSSGAYNATSIAVADLNGDGKPDLVAANQCAADGCATGSVAVLLNITGPCVKKCPTSAVLASSLNPSIYGQKITWTATVTTSGSVPPTGKVNFTWGSALYSFGTATLNSSGVAILTRSLESADSYQLTAVYSGDASNLGSTSAALHQVITEATTSATLTSSPNPSTLGQSVTFTAKISSPTVTPSGPVTFTAGKTVLGTGQLSGGKAKFTISTLAVGSTKVTVTYDGDSNIAKSSASVTQAVQQ